MTLLHQELSEIIIASYYQVYNTLGFGFLEKVYEQSLAIELDKYALSVECQYPIQVFYDKQPVGKYYADILVEGKVILELKAAATLNTDHDAQLLNYLSATDIELGFLFNFGKIPQFSRKVYENSLKKRR